MPMLLAMRSSTVASAFTRSGPRLLAASALVVVGVAQIAMLVTVVAVMSAALPQAFPPRRWRSVRAWSCRVCHGRYSHCCGVFPIPPQRN